MRRDGGHWQLATDDFPKSQMSGKARHGRREEEEEASGPALAGGIRLAGGRGAHKGSAAAVNCNRAYNLTAVGSEATLQPPPQPPALLVSCCGN